MQVIVHKAQGFLVGNKRVVLDYHPHRAITVPDFLVEVPEFKTCIKDGSIEVVDATPEAVQFVAEDVPVPVIAEPAAEPAPKKTMSRVR